MRHKRISLFPRVLGHRCCLGIISNQCCRFVFHAGLPSTPHGFKKSINAKIANPLKQRNSSTKAVAAATAAANGFGDVEQLPDLFTDKHFLLYGEFSAVDRRQLTRYIVAYNG